jgi:acetyl esterase/lipase
VVTVPFGYLWTVGVLALGTLLVLRPLRRPAPLATLSFLLGAVIGELALLALLWLAGSTALALAQDDLGSPVGWAAAGVAVLTSVGLALVVRDGLTAGPAVDRALRRTFGTGHGHRRPRIRRLLAPFPVRPRGVQRVRNIGYGERGRWNRLDLYRSRSRPRHAPVLIHFHGGHFRSGGKSRECRALLHGLARRGWVCVSANYRLRGAGRFPRSLIDAKRVIAWVRQHAADHGADPSTVLVAGSSAGAHLAAMAALTPGEPSFQPGFEAADTSVSAAICLYGYYGPREASAASSPYGWLGPAAPPFLVVHGDRDTVVPVDTAATFAHALDAASAGPVVYAELPGAQHGFDLFASPRFESVVDAIETFAAHVGEPPAARDLKERE